MSISHIASFERNYYTDKYTYKVFDYNDGIRLDDESVEDHYVINVPCYKLSDVLKMVYGKSHYGSLNRFWEMFGHAISIETSNHHGKRHDYLLATPETIEFVRQQSIVGGLKGHITKVPKLHTKTVHVLHRGPWHTTAYKFSKPPIKVDAYIASKDQQCRVDYALKQSVRA